MRDHLLEPGFSEFTFVAGSFAFGLFDSRIEVEGVPGNDELGVGMGGLVSCHRFFETALTDETPWADL